VLPYPSKGQEPRTMKVLLFCLWIAAANAFTIAPGADSLILRARRQHVSKQSAPLQHQKTFQLFASESEVALSESDQTVLGVLGTVSSLIVFYSEFVLKTTGCGLPAGPFGLFGLAEGIRKLPWNCRYRRIFCLYQDQNWIWPSGRTCRFTGRR
jgi:hypothetical protein